MYSHSFIFHNQPTMIRYSLHFTGEENEPDRLSNLPIQCPCLVGTQTSGDQLDATLHLKYLTLSCLASRFPVAAWLPR